MASIMAISGFSTLVLLPAMLSWSHRWLFASRAPSATPSDTQAIGS
jgi:hypothetical protein